MFHLYINSVAHIKRDLCQVGTLEKCGTECVEDSLRQTHFRKMEKSDLTDRRSDGTGKQSSRTAYEELQQDIVSSGGQGEKMSFE